MIDIVKEQGYAGITDLFAGELAEDPTVFIEVGNPVDTAARYAQSHEPTDIMPEIEAAVEAGKIVTAENPKELTEKLDMTYLEETIQRYNTLCEQGKDTDHAPAPIQQLAWVWIVTHGMQSMAFLGKSTSIYMQSVIY